MGYSYRAYHFYGVHVPSDQWTEDYAAGEGDRIDGVISGLGFSTRGTKVGHLSAGKYDQDMFFLLIDIYGLDTEVDLGEYRVSMPPAAVPREWDQALTAVAKAAGYTGLARPGWITVPSVD